MKNILFILFVFCITDTYSQYSTTRAASEASSSGVNIPWWNIDSGFGLDGQLIETEVCSSASTDTLVLTDFMLNIPSNATVEGIEVRIDKFTSSPDELYDQSIKLINTNSDAIVENKADLTNYWPAIQSTSMYGEPTDMWGVPFTPAILNSPDFGLEIVAAPSEVYCINAWIDYVTITVYYSIEADCVYELTIIEEQQCSNFYMFNINSISNPEVNTYWDFGDGTTSQVNGILNEHYYDTPGDYSGSVTFSHPDCPQDSTIYFDITASPCNNCIEEVIIEEVGICGTYSFFLGANQFITQANIDYGDGNYDQGTEGFFTHTYNEPGIYNGSAWYISDECNGNSNIQFTVIVEDCEEDCSFELYWEEATDCYYTFTPVSTAPNSQFYYNLNGVNMGNGSSMTLFLPDGQSTLCITNITDACPEGYEECTYYDIDASDCVVCPNEVVTFPVAEEECGLMFLTTYQDYLGEVEWHFGDGTIETGTMSTSHVYLPGFYEGYINLGSACGGDSIVNFELSVPDCEDCFTNNIDMQWSVTNFGMDQYFDWTLYEVGENINSLELITNDSCFASDFSSCEFNECLEDGCYVIYFSSETEFELFDFDLLLQQDGVEIPYTFLGISPTTGFYVYFNLGNSSCVFEENCILDFGYETLDENTFNFSALTNSTSEVEWDFGDGTTGTGWPIEHSYDEPGDYTVCVSFVDNTLCDNSSSCGIVYVDDTEECVETTITISGNIDEQGIEALSLILLSSEIEILSETLIFNNQINTLTFVACLPDGCYELGLTPDDGISDLLDLSILVTVNGVIIAQYDENSNSDFIGVNFGVNDSSCFSSIEDMILADFSVYPNPAKESFMINIPSLTEQSTLTLINILGQPVMTKKLDQLTTEINISELSNGQYQLLINNGEEYQVKKINIQR